MGKVATGTITTALPPIDWRATKEEIVSKLDIRKEYAELGLVFTSETPTSKGFLECHAAGRNDHSPSAAVKLSTGVYVDNGGEHLTLGFLDFVLKFGRFGSWMEAVKHYAAKAGVTLGRVEYSTNKVLEHVYKYHEANGVLSYGVFRYVAPMGKKDFRQYPWRNDGWVKERGCMDGVAPLPYRLPELIASPPEDVVLVLEGEKDCDRAVAEGWTATTNHQGSKSTPNTWPKPSFLPHFKDRQVVVVPDNDKPGRDHAHRVCGYLQKVAKRVQYLELPGLASKGDLSDWFDAGHDSEELGRLIVRAIDWSPELAIEKEADVPVIAPDVRFKPEDVVIKKMSTYKPRKVDWLIPGKVPLGKLTLVAGDPGLGKSFLTMDWAARISVGGEIPGTCGECFDRGSSLIFFAEDGAEDTVVPRLMAANADLDRIATIQSIADSMGRPTPFSLAYMDQLDYALSTMPDCRMLVIDPISSYIGRDADEHRNAEIRTVLSPLADLAEKRNVAAVLVTHINKGSAANALKRITGSIAYSALARTVWLVAKDKDDKTRRLFLPVKNNLAPDQDGLAYRITNGVMDWEDESIEMSANDALSDGGETRNPVGRPKKSREEVAAWLYAYIQSNGPQPDGPVFAAGAIAGYGRDLVWEAKNIVGIKAAKGIGGEWNWHLPAFDYRTLNPPTVGEF